MQRPPERIDDRIHHRRIAIERLVGEAEMPDSVSAREAAKPAVRRRLATLIGNSIAIRRAQLLRRSGR